MSAQDYEYWIGIATELDGLPYGGKQQRIEEIVQAMNISRQTVYRRLQKYGGWTSNGKVRKDKGDCALADDELMLIANYMLQTTRNNGKRLMSVKTAIEILYADGQLKTRLHPNTVSKRLMEKGIHPDQLNVPTPHISMRSEHPNYVWQVDASVCVLYYMDKGGVEIIDENKCYKNKPHNLEKLKNKRVLRYVMTDHYSGALKVLYFEGSGETQELLIKFLIWAFSKQSDHLMHGVPLILQWDKGSANTSHMAKAFLEHLGVKHIPHATGNSRAKGSVEKGQDVVERNFESRLVSITPKSIDELNELAMRWQITFNNVEKMRRHGHTRMQMWQRNSQPLRLCPPPEICTMLCESKPETRTVTGKLTVQFKVPGHPSRHYRVKHIPDIRINQSVQVTVNPYRAPNIMVTLNNHLGESCSYECEPMLTDEAGFEIDAPVIGEEIRTAPKTTTDTIREDMLKQAHNTDSLENAQKAADKKAPVFTNINAMADVDAVEDKLPALMQRKGEVIEVKPKVATAPPLGFVPTLVAVREKLGSDLTAQQRERVRELYPDGANEDEIPAIVDMLSSSNVVELSKASGE